MYLINIRPEFKVREFLPLINPEPEELATSYATEKNAIRQYSGKSVYLAM